MHKIFVTLMSAVSLVGAVPAGAQTLLLDTNLTVPMAATMDDPCSSTVEAIVFQGTTQLAQRVWLLGNGNFRLQIVEQTALQGQDSAILLGTSPTYTVSAPSNIDIEFMPDSVTVWDYKQVTNNGATQDNFHSVLAMDFDPTSLKLNLSLAPACSDGLPH